MNKKLDLVAARDWLGRALQTNKELLLPVAGVFSVLPNLIFAYATQRDMATFQAGMAQVSASMNNAGANPEVAFSRMGSVVSTYYSAVWPWVLLVALCSLWGSVVLYRIFLKPGSENVGQAIVNALPMILPIFLANILITVVSMLVVMLPATLGGLTGNAGVVGLMVFAGGIASIYVSVRLYLYTAAMVDRDNKNPVTGLLQSWGVTGGNFWAIFLYSAILLIGAVIIYMILAMVTGLIDAMILGDPKSGNMPILSTILGAMFAGAVSILIAGGISSVWRQLSPSAEDVIEVFE